MRRFGRLLLGAGLVALVLGLLVGWSPLPVKQWVEALTSITRDLDRIPRIHNTQSFTVFSYNPHRRNSYPLVRAVKRLAKTRPVPISTKSSCDKDLLLG